MAYRRKTVARVYPPLTAEERAMVAAALPGVARVISRKAAAVRGFLGALGAGWDDIEQEAYLTACRAAKTWRDDGRPFEQYAKMAACTHIDLLCRRASAGKRRRPPRTARRHDPAAPSPPLTEAAFDAALAELPADQEAAIRAYAETRSIGRAAKKLRMNYARCDGLIFRAELSLRGGK